MRILTFALCLLCFSVSAQNNSINVYPWNPDSDQDNQIGVDDLQSFLTVYGNDFGLPPEPCTYDGTTIENFFIGLNTGEVILDSLYVEFELEDISTYYLEGCPNQVTDTVIYAWSGWNHNGISPYGNGYKLTCWSQSGNTFEITYLTNLSNGEYDLYLGHYALNNFNSDGFFGGSWSIPLGPVTIPWPESWHYNEYGIVFDFIEGDPSMNGWPTYANYMHILPYWHYADE